MNKLIFILGSGGHAKVLLEALRKKDTKIAGFLEIDKKLIGNTIFDFPIYDQEKIFNQYSPNDIFLVNGIGSTHIPTLRKKQFDMLKKRGYPFLTVTHPTAYYSDDVIIGEGTQLLTNSVVLTGTKIGCNTIINTSSSIDHDCEIGNHVHIAPGVVLSGSVKIEEGCHIGTGASIIQGISVGENSLIAAGAVVVKNVLPNSVMAGVPARQR